MRSVSRLRAGIVLPALRGCLVRRVRVGAFLILWCGLCSPCLAQPGVATVRGRLLHATFPAAGIAVQVCSPNPQVGCSAMTYTGPDGMYYLYNVPLGSYTLKVFVNPVQAYEMNYQINVSTVQLSDVAPIVLP